jgi:hypothetical protein
MRSLHFALALLPLLAACGTGEAAPEPDPAHVERLLARLEPEPAAAPALPEEKLAKADRLVGALEKVEPKRIDPSVAETLLAR